MLRTESSTISSENPAVCTPHHHVAEKLQRLLPRIIAILGCATLASAMFSASTVNHETWLNLKDFPIGFLALGALIGTMPWFTHTLRLWIWTSFLKLRFSFKQLFHISVASEVTSAALPTIIGGGGTRVAMLVAHGTAPGVAASLGVLGTLEDMAFFILALPLALILAPATFSSEGGYIFSHLGELRLSQLSILEIIAVAAAGVGGVILFKNLAPARWRKKIRQFFSTIGEWLRQSKSIFQELIARGKWRFVLAVGLAALQWSSRYCLLGLLLWGLELAPNFLEIFVTQWVVFTLMNLFPSPGATGGAEVTFALMYKSLIPENLLGVMGAAWRVFTFTLPVALATLVLFMMMGNRKKSK
jgi:hypothetical protein